MDPHFYLQSSTSTYLYRPFTMWPQLSDTDLGQVANLIMRLYHPNLDPSSAKALQQELQQIQSAPHAWGLVTGLSTHADPNVRFFSAHTAQVKISRDWETLPNELHPELLKLLLHTLSTALAPPFVYQPANAVVVRKLFGSLASLMIRLPFHQFSQPIVTVLHTIESTAATTELPPSAPSSGFNTPIPSEVARHRLWRLEWCGICVEEIGRAGISAQKRCVRHQVELTVDKRFRGIYRRMYRRSCSVLSLACRRLGRKLKRRASVQRHGCCLGSVESEYLMSVDVGSSAQQGFSATKVQARLRLRVYGSLEPGP